MGTIGELKALLEERGVEYRVLPDSHTTHVWFDGYRLCETGDGMVVAYNLTPEQAVEATLGPGECHAEHVVDDDILLDRYECGECGTIWWMFDTPVCRCPRCGRRVVGE